MRTFLHRALGAILLLLPAAAFGADERPSLTRYVPAGELILYAEFDGLDAHAEAWKKSAANKMLTGTTLGDLVESLGAQGIELSRRGMQQNGATAADMIISAKVLAKQGFVTAFFGKGLSEGRGMMVIRGGKAPEIHRLVEAWLLGQIRNQGIRNSKPVTKAGRSITFAGVGANPLAYWDEGEDCVICDLKSVDRIIETLDGKVEGADKNPIIADLKKTEGSFMPIAVAFLDPTALGPMATGSSPQGLEGLERLDLRIGFDGEAMTTITRIVAPSPRKGLLSALDQPSFTLQSLPPLPKGLTGFTVFSLDAPKLYDRFLDLMESGSEDPSAGKKVTELRLRQSLGIDLRKDLLTHLGPKIAIYAAPMKPGAEGVAATILDIRVSVQIDDAEPVGKAVGLLLERMNAQFGFRPPAAAEPVSPGFHKVEGPGVVYTLTLPPDTTLPGPLEALEPTVAVGKDRLVIAATRKAANSALAVGLDGKPLWAPSESFAALAQSLPKEMVFLNINDPRETLPPLVASLPFLLESMNKAIEETDRANGMRPNPGQRIPIELDPAKVPTLDDLSRPLFPGWFAATTNAQGMTLITRDALPNVASPGAAAGAIAFLLPAVQASREAARRAQCVNHLKMIGLAMHNYHSANNTFPRQAITDKDGKPLLSWRVAILPYLEQQALYNKFKLDEPWDSPHNKPLLDEMPEVFACTTAPKTDPKGTHYRVFVGNGALFDAKEAIGLANVTDGTSNTIMVVETKDTVLWTKPDDLEFDPRKPAPFGAGSFHPGGYNALFGDGSVKFLKSTINVNVLRALITRAAGEVISADAY